MKKSITVLLLILIILISFSGCGDNTNENQKNEVPSFFDEYPTGEEVETVSITQNPVAAVKLSDGSEIIIELYYYTAPNAVTDFIALAEEGIYNGMALNEVRNDCIIMLGSTDGEFDPPYYVMDETDADEAHSLSHRKGVVSMVRTSNADTLTGQFFILTEDQTHFDGRFTPIGVITSGLDTAEKIAASEKDENDMLVSPYVIESVEIEKYGIDFPNPTIIKK